MKKYPQLEALMAISKFTEENTINGPGKYDYSFKTEEIEEQVNAKIRESWEIGEAIAEKAVELKKGDTAMCINDGKMQEVTVKYHGKYKNDYNDNSMFVRVAGGGYTWYQSRESIVKK